MSGGSFNYLFRQYPPRREDLERMANRLDFIDSRAAGETRALIRSTALAEELADELADRQAPLRILWKAIEWRDSGDWGDEEVGEALRAYRAVDSTPDTAARLAHLLGRLVDQVIAEWRERAEPGFPPPPNPLDRIRDPDRPGDAADMRITMFWTEVMAKLINSGALLGAQGAELEQLRGWDRDAYGVVCKYGHHTRFRDAVGDPTREDWRCPHCAVRGGADPGALENLIRDTILGAGMRAVDTVLTETSIRTSPLTEDLRRAVTTAYVLTPRHGDSVAERQHAQLDAITEHLLAAVGGDWTTGPDPVILAKMARGLIRQYEEQARTGDCPRCSIRDRARADTDAALCAPCETAVANQCDCIDLDDIDRCPGGSCGSSQPGEACGGCCACDRTRFSSHRPGGEPRHG